MRLQLRNRKTVLQGQGHMVGFRNIAVNDYQTLQLPITVSIITTHLDEFLQYSQAVLLSDAASAILKPIRSQ